MPPHRGQKARTPGKDYRVNRQIRAREVRGIRGADSSDSEVLSVQDALNLADEEGLDLVEVAPTQVPPVCRLMDYGRFKFAQAKKARDVRKSRVGSSEQREVRLRVRIGEHDIKSKVRRVSHLLGGGSKVKISVFFRGREIAHPELAVNLLRRVAEALSSEAKLERAPVMEGRALSVILSPLKGQSASTAAGVFENA